MKMRFIQLIVAIKYILVLIYVKIFKRKIENVWLISERGDEARDNGFAFFEYMQEMHPEIITRFVISKTSPDYKKLEKYKNNIIIYRSWRHFYYFINSRVLISTHIMGFSPEFRMMGKLERKNILYFKGVQVFLQHGITKDNSAGLYFENTHLNIFICGAKKEYDYVKKYFHYNNEVKYTGFARYDNLISKEDNTILLMPTWRENLYHLGDEEFVKTNYYKKYESLIKNVELNNTLKKYNYKLIFYPHYEIQKRLYLFKTNLSNIIIGSSTNYSVPNLLRNTSLLITDFSSVYFDVAYMNKPVIYYHFDYDEYRKEHYKEGYFSYVNDGFGQIVNDEKELIEKIKYYFVNNFKIEEKYIERINDFFPTRDKNNSKRIYEKIVKIIN